MLILFIMSNNYQLFGVLCLLVLRFITSNKAHCGHSSGKSATTTPAWSIPDERRDIDTTAAWSMTLSISICDVKFLCRLKLPPLNLITAGDVELNPRPSSHPHADSDATNTSSIFDKLKGRGLHFLHVNARSFIPKISELRTVAHRTRPAVVCITEFWLDSSVTDGEIQIEGYDVLRRDRNRNGGGVCAFVRNDSAYNPREDLRLKILLAGYSSAKIQTYSFRSSLYAR